MVMVVVVIEVLAVLVVVRVVGVVVLGLQVRVVFPCCSSSSSTGVLPFLVVGRSRAAADAPQRGRQ
jgi:hypothetical protein